MYIPSKDLQQRGTLFTVLATKGVKTIHLAEFSDEWLRQDLQAAAEQYRWKMHFYPSPGFLCTEGQLQSFFTGKEHYSMAQFYAYQRKRLQILMEGSKPVGGKFSFDVENRKKIPKGTQIPRPYAIKDCETLTQVIEEVDDEFSDAWGTVNPFLYPTTHDEARQALQEFLHKKLAHFGAYQDAIQTEGSFLFHSVLSPLLNVGLLTPGEVLKATLDYARPQTVPLNSLEGFIRQIIGWREYVRGSYMLKGSYQRTLNFFGHHQNIPRSFLKGTTGILPIDTVVQHVLKTGYCNHIERLMVLGNFLLLTETCPQEVYKFFMGFFVDAYDWVMVPNVYGMTQYSDGGVIVTKPYISGSNYILKMSDFPKGEWTEIWDGLFWRFIKLHRSLFSENPRTQMLVSLYDKNEANLPPKIAKAEQWLTQYRNS